MLNFPKEDRAGFAVQLAVAYGCGLWRGQAGFETGAAWGDRWKRAEEALVANITDRVTHTDAWLAHEVAGYPGATSCSGLPGSNLHIAAIFRSLLDPLAPLHGREMRISCISEGDGVRGIITLLGQTDEFLCPLLRGNKRVFEVLAGSLEVQCGPTDPATEVRAPATLRLSWSRDAGLNEFLLLETETTKVQWKVMPGKNVDLKASRGKARWVTWECGCGRIDRQEAFGEGQLRNIDSLDRKLMAKGDPVSAFLDTWLPKYGYLPKVRDKIIEKQEKTSRKKSLKEMWTKILNKLIEDPMLWKDPMWKEAVSRQTTVAHLGSDAGGVQGVKLHRMLLVDAFPHELSDQLGCRAEHRI